MPLSGKEKRISMQQDVFLRQAKRKRETRSERMNICSEFFNHEWSLDILRVFFSGINIIVLTQLAMGVGAVYFFRYFRIWLDLKPSLIVSPIVFPLAFAINIDFQRREKILHDLGKFKSSVMVFYFCTREFKHASGLDSEWFNTLRKKLAYLSLNIREYLVMEKKADRRVLLEVIYENIGLVHELFLKIRTSTQGPSNGPFISRIVQTISEMSSSFESLQNHREYRSSRAIRSFNKVMVFLLPMLLSPYFVFIGETNKNEWTPYYIAVVSVFIFSTLQGVHDKLDNPFDGMGEDDIELDVFEEWVSEILEYDRKTEGKVYENFHKVSENHNVSEIHKVSENHNVSEIHKVSENHNVSDMVRDGERKDTDIDVVRVDLEATQTLL